MDTRPWYAPLPVFFRLVNTSKIKSLIFLNRRIATALMRFIPFTVFLFISLFLQSEKRQCDEISDAPSDSLCLRLSETLQEEQHKKTALQTKHTGDTNTEDCRPAAQFLPTSAYGLQEVKDQHKTSMKNKYKSLFEEIKLEENQTLPNRIYTRLYIIEGESEGVNEEHEVLQMKKRPTTQDTLIYCNDIFQPLQQPGCQEKDKIKTVLTKGIAGIGKPSLCRS